MDDDSKVLLTDNLNVGVDLHIRDDIEEISTRVKVGGKKYRTG